MIEIEMADKLRFAFARKQETEVKILILVGGRSSTKSTGVGDAVLSYVQSGQRWACAREFQNSIEDSVHALLSEEIERLEMEGFDVKARDIDHVSGGKVFYKGLARNVKSIKSLICDGMWIEEGETLSEATIEVLTASIRVSAAKAARARKAGVEAQTPDVIITMNRGSSNDPVSKAFLKAAEPDIARQGYYEDENVLIVEVNYTDIPEQWFKDSGLEPERLRDKRLMSLAEYEHKWLGKYNDSIENSIIKTEWFDACVDAHEKLGFEALGEEKVSFDPADVGNDPEALAYMHGVVIKEAMSADVKDIEEACKWAVGYANGKRVDKFVWDCDGMGVGLKAQVRASFEGKGTSFEQFKGSHGPWMPDEEYLLHEDEKAGKERLTNKNVFLNQRAQFYWELRRRCFNTFLAVTKGTYINPEEMISFSSSISHLDLLRAEVCKIPRKFGASGRIQLMTKAEMLAKGIPSPNIADCVMMLMKPSETEHEPVRLAPMKGWGQ